MLRLDEGKAVWRGRWSGGSGFLAVEEARRLLQWNVCWVHVSTARRLGGGFCWLGRQASRPADVVSGGGEATRLGEAGSGEAGMVAVGLRGGC